MSNANMKVLMFASVALFAFLLCSSVNTIPSRPSLESNDNHSIHNISKIGNATQSLVLDTLPPLAAQSDDNGEYNISNYTLGEVGKRCLPRYKWECRTDADCIKYNLRYGFDCGGKDLILIYLAFRAIRC